MKQVIMKIIKRNKRQFNQKGKNISFLFGMINKLKQTGSQYTLNKIK